MYKLLKITDKKLLKLQFENPDLLSISERCEACFFECGWAGYKCSYELTMRCQKHNLKSLISTRVANNFLQVIYSLKNQYSYDVRGDWS